MTLSCPSSSCPFCIGDACNACRKEPRARGWRCHHDHVERHAAIPALDPDTTKTVQVEPLLAGRIEIDLSDADAAASFLEVVAKVMRAKKRIVLVVE